MKVIVTGSNGFIGSELIKRLFDNGHEVIAVVKDTDEKITSIDGKVARIVYDDLTGADALCEKIGENADVFYHLAWGGVNGPSKASYSVQLNNIKMACECAYAAKRLGCSRFLIAGTVAENAVKSFEHLQSVSGGLMYAVAKQSAHIFTEGVCKNIGLPFVWMQFSNIFGPNNRTGNLVSYTLSQLLDGQPATFGPAQQPYDFVFVDDLIEAVYRLGIKDRLGKDSYFIGSGAPRKLCEYLTAIGKKLGREELIQLNARPDDGIVYTNDMFDIKPLVDDIGEYVSVDFEKALDVTVDGYKKER